MSHRGIGNSQECVDCGLEIFSETNYPVCPDCGLGPLCTECFQRHSGQDPSEYGYGCQGTEISDDAYSASPTNRTAGQDTDKNRNGPTMRPPITGSIFFNLPAKEASK